MSQLESIFMDGDLAPREAALHLAQVLGLQYLPPEDPTGSPIVRALDLGGVPGFVGGPVGTNLLSWPEDPDKGDEVAVYDAYRLEWTVWSEQRGRDYADQERAAEALFRLLTDNVAWPAALLLHNAEVLRDLRPGAGAAALPGKYACGRHHQPSSLGERRRRVDLVMAGGRGAGPRGRPAGVLPEPHPVFGQRRSGVFDRVAEDVASWRGAHRVLAGWQPDLHRAAAMSAAASAEVRWLYWGVDAGVVLTSLVDLEQRLDAMHEAARHDDDPLLVTLQSGDDDPVDDRWPPTLFLVLGREWSALRYDNSALPEVSSTSIGDPGLASDDPEDDIAVAWGDDFSWFRGENLLPVEYAREAVRQFWPEGERPTVCSWRD